ncbi:MAG: hypothetical protein Q9187_002377, partial [Circinaria calcarea]
MTTAIEARSLSSVTALAANPPRYPRNPTHTIQQPLVLYIARVPGSRDVFLSTLKPREKVVTAQDIESSLYYFHVDAPYDEDLRQALSSTEVQQEKVKLDDNNEGLSETAREVQRKPLPSSPRLDLGDHPEPPPKILPNIQGVSQELRDISNARRKPVGGDNKRSIPLPESTSSMPARKLLGPRPLHSRQTSVDAAALGVNTRKENVTLRRWSEQPPASTKTLGLPSTPELMHQATSFNTPAKDSSTSGETRRCSRSEERLVRNRDLSITLIRRDPTSGSQWNVGKISGSFNGTRDEESPASYDASPGAEKCGFLIEITTPGYVKFIGVDNVLPLSTSNITNVPKTSKLTACFQRYLLTKSSKAISENQSDNNSLRPSLDLHRSSTPSVNSLGIQGHSCRTSLESSPAHMKAYTFLSPWNGDCEFTTGIAGRSLKCRHTIPSPATSPGKGSTPAVTVSELRFNLPGSNIFSPVSPKRPPLSAAFRSSKESSSLIDHGIN